MAFKFGKFEMNISILGLIILLFAIVQIVSIVYSHEGQGDTQPRTEVKASGQ